MFEETFLEQSIEYQQNFYNQLSIIERHRFLADFAELFAKHIFDQLLDNLNIDREYWYTI